MEFRAVAAFVTRILQVVFCIVCVGTAGYWAKTWMPFRTQALQVAFMLESVNLAIFAGATGALLSGFMLFAPRATPALADDLPGLVDLSLSGIWSVFFLAAGASLVSWGPCKGKGNPLCPAWNATIGVSFFLWVLYLLTAIMAGLDLRAQILALRAQAQQAVAAPAATPASKTDKAAAKLAKATGQEAV